MPTYVVTANYKGRVIRDYIEAINPNFAKDFFRARYPEDARIMSVVLEKFSPYRRR